MRIIILGAGWYGLHLSNVLDKLSIEHIILEKSNAIFSGSSSKNQNRLHLGFHYPRSMETIDECRKGYTRMLEEYGECIEDIENNYYLIHKNSRTTQEDYEKLFNIKPVDIPEFLVNEHFQSCYIVPEKVINFHKAIQLFKHKPVIFNCGEITDLTYNGVKYDYIMDCTFNQSQLSKSLLSDITSELCLTLLYEGHGPPITVMDGLFYSLYPYGNNIYTLTDVEHTPLIKGTMEQIMEYDASNIDIVRHKMEMKIGMDYPAFKSKFIYKGYFLSIKNKMDYVSDNRSLYVYNDGQHVIFVGGKITGIFAMEEYILNLFHEKSLTNHNIESK
jgi:hypothetical protein